MTLNNNSINVDKDIKLFHWSTSLTAFNASEIDFAKSNSSSAKVKESFFLSNHKNKASYLEVKKANLLLCFYLKQDSKLIKIHESDMAPFDDFCKWVDSRRQNVDILEIAGRDDTYYAVLNIKCLKDY